MAIWEDIVGIEPVNVLFIQPDSLDSKHVFFNNESDVH